jgi:hypothetical protein
MRNKVRTHAFLYLKKQKAKEIRAKKAGTSPAKKGAPPAKKGAAPAPKKTEKKTAEKKK